MKKFTPIFCFLILFTTVHISAQVELPYYSGFDNTEERAGWVEYKTASTEFSHWNYANFEPHSEPTYIGHDYSPSTGITLTDNWFVSPGFSIVDGGKLDSLWYKFSGFSTPTDGDTIGIYLLSGSQDPEMASRFLLHDFRGEDYITDNTFRFLNDINLPASNEISHIAIRYRNVNVSAQWLTVGFDDLYVSGNTVGNNEKELSNVSVSPNPSNGLFIVKHSASAQSILIYNDLGQQVRQIQNISGQTQTNLDLSSLPNGIYILHVKEGTQTYTHKLILR